MEAGAQGAAAASNTGSERNGPDVKHGPSCPGGDFPRPGNDPKPMKQSSIASFSRGPSMGFTSAADGTSHHLGEGGMDVDVNIGMGAGSSSPAAACSRASASAMRSASTQSRAIGNDDSRAEVAQPSLRGTLGGGAPSTSGQRRVEIVHRVRGQSECWGMGTVWDFASVL